MREFPNSSRPRNTGCWSLNFYKSNMKRKLRFVLALSDGIQFMFFSKAIGALDETSLVKGFQKKTAVKVVCGVFKLSLLRDDRDGCEFSGHFHSPRNHFLIVIFNLAHEETTFSAQSRKLSIPFCVQPFFSKLNEL